MTADLLLAYAVDHPDFAGMPYMHPAAGDPVNALDLHDAHVAFDLYTPSEAQGLCIGVAHFVVYNRMIFRYFSVCLTNQAIDYAFADFRLIGLYGQVFITLMDCDRTYFVHGEQ